MRNFSYDFVLYENTYIRAIEKVGGTTDFIPQVRILTNTGPYNDGSKPVRLVLDLNDQEKVVARRVQGCFGERLHGSLQDDWIDFMRVPNEAELEGTQKVLTNAQNGIYGKINIDIQVFLKKILLQILT